jgi:hypothetical protein
MNIQYIICCDNMKLTDLQQSIQIYVGVETNSLEIQFLVLYAAANLVVITSSREGDAAAC